MSWKDYRKESRSNYGTDQDKLTLEQINAGSIMRIADAVEVMCKDRVKLESDLLYYKNAFTMHQNVIKDLNNQIKGLKAAKSRFKNQLKLVKEQ